MIFKHKLAATPLENLMSAELILGREVLAMHKVKYHQSVSQEIPYENDVDKNSLPILVKRGVNEESLDTCDIFF